MSIDIGKVCEYFFAAELLSRGYVPLWPSTESKPYDLVVDLGKKCRRIQVKGTAKTGAVIDVQFMMNAGPRKRRYHNDEVDFIVLKVLEFDAWYIFPIKDVETGVRIKPGSPHCKYKKYLEAWDLLK